MPSAAPSVDPTLPVSQELLATLRDLENEHGCRIEVSSHDEKFPFSASALDGSAYGFGKTVGEAVAKLNEKLTALKAAEKR